MAKSVQFNSVVQDFNDDCEQSGEDVWGLPLAVGLVRPDESKRIVDKRGSFDMDQLAAQLTELATRRTVKTGAAKATKQQALPKQQVHPEVSSPHEVSSLQSYVSRLELLQAMLGSETILEQLASLGLQWGESAEVDQKFTSAMQHVHLTIETLRQVRHAMSDFDLHCDMKPEDLGLRYPKELNETMQRKSVQTMPGHHLDGHVGDAFISTQDHHARVLGGTSSPHAALRRSVVSPMNYEQSVGESHDHSAFVKILKQVLSQSDMFFKASQAAAEPPPMPRWVMTHDTNPINSQKFSETKDSDIQFQQDFCQVIHHHGLEMEHIMPIKQLPPVKLANSSYRGSAPPDGIDVATRFSQPAMSSWERAGDFKHHADTLDGVSLDADKVFEKGMSALLPSFFLATSQS